MRYLTPHSKWSIHSEYQDNLFMLSLSRGGPTIWMSPARTRPGSTVHDNDWIEAVNRNGVVVVARDRLAPHARGDVSTCTTRRTAPIDVPKSETSGQRGGIHNSLTRLLVKPTHLIGGYAQLSYAFNYLGPTGNQRDEVTVIRKRIAGGDVLMKVMAQMAHGDEPRQVHRVPHLLGHLQAGVDQPAGHGVRLVQQRRDPPRAGLSAHGYEDQERVEGRLGR